MCAYTAHVYERRKKNCSILLLTDMHFTSVRTFINKKKYQNTPNPNPDILLEKSYHEVSLKKRQKISDTAVLTCWITLTRSFSTCLRLRTSLFVMTAVVKYLRICGHIVWIALRYLERKKPQIQNSKGTLKLADDTKMGGAVNSSKVLQRDRNKEIRGLDNHQMY